MSALREAFDAIRQLAVMSQDVYNRAMVGAMPENDSLVMTVSAGGEENVGLDLCGDLNLDVVVNAKHRLQTSAWDALNDIHYTLSRMKNLPTGDGWQVLSVSTSSTPTFIEFDGDQYLYGSGLEVHIYIE
jgi:hypothetical protein